jgi:hypothetical protein
MTDYRAPMIDPSRVIDLNTVIDVIDLNTVIDLNRARQR